MVNVLIREYEENPRKGKQNCAAIFGASIFEEPGMFEHIEKSGDKTRKEEH